MSSTAVVRGSASPYSPDAFQAWLSARNEAAFVADRRRKAFDLYRGLLESPLDPEEYKRIDLRTFRPDQYRPSAAGAADAGTVFTTLMQHRTEFGGAVVHVDGRCVK